MITHSVGRLRSGAPTLSSFKISAPRADRGAPLDEVPTTAVRPSEIYNQEDVRHQDVPTTRIIGVFRAWCP